MLKISELTFNEVKKIHSDRAIERAIEHEESKPMANEPIIVRFMGCDVGDHYAIIEDRQDDKSSFNPSYFMFWFDNEKDKVPCLWKKCDTMAEAAAQMALRFVIDNCDGADTCNKFVERDHDFYQRTLSTICPDVPSPRSESIKVTGWDACDDTFVYEFKSGREESMDAGKFADMVDEYGEPAEFIGKTFII